MAFTRDGIAIIGDAARKGAPAKSFKHLVAGAPIEITDANMVRFQVSGVVDLAPVDVEVPIAFMLGIVGPWLSQIAKQNGINLNMQAV